MWFKLLDRGGERHGHQGNSFEAREEQFGDAGKLATRWPTSRLAMRVPFDLSVVSPLAVVRGQWYLLFKSY